MVVHCTAQVVRKAALLHVLVLGPGMIRAQEYCLLKYRSRKSWFRVWALSGSFTSQRLAPRQVISYLEELSRPGRGNLFLVSEAPKIIKVS